MPTRRTRTPANAGPRWGAELTRIELLRLREVLRLAGISLTPTRAAVLWGLQRSTTPVTLAELSESLGARGWTRSAVSRAVNDLVGARLVTRAKPTGRGVELLAAAPEPELPEGTVYFLCDGCSVNECLEDAHVVATAGVSGPKALPRVEVTEMVESLCRRREGHKALLLPTRAR